MAHVHIWDPTSVLCGLVRFVAFRVQVKGSLRELMVDYYLVHVSSAISCGFHLYSFLLSDRNIHFESWFPN